MAAPKGRGDTKLRLIIALAMVAVFLATRYWLKDEAPKPNAERPQATAPETPAASETESPPPAARPIDSPKLPAPRQPTEPRESKPPAANTKFHLDGATAKNVVLRDVEDRIVFRGDVDLQPTLDRIDAGQRLDRYNNDGIVFQNREGRLPRKPPGYYREWVQPTENLRGPGPQRIVSGKDGDRWYTPDHYAHFYRIQP